MWDDRSVTASKEPFSPRSQHGSTPGGPARLFAVVCLSATVDGLKLRTTGTPTQQLPARVEPQTWSEQELLLLLRSRADRGSAHRARHKRPPRLVPPARGRNKMIPATFTTNKDKQRRSVADTQYFQPRAESTARRSPAWHFQFAPRGDRSWRAAGVLPLRGLRNKREEEASAARGEITSTGREAGASGVCFLREKEENGAQDGSCWVARRALFRTRNGAASGSEKPPLGAWWAAVPLHGAPNIQRARCKVRLHFSVFLHNGIIRVFYVDASCSENMEFLKGPRTRRPSGWRMILGRSDLQLAADGITSTRTIHTGYQGDIFCY